MTKSLVTGATGFIGSRLVEYLLQAGESVTCLVRSAARAEKLQKLGATLRLGDVATGEGLDSAVAGCDVVYHLAGLIRSNSRQMLFRTNAEGTSRIVEACARRVSPATLVYVSSLAVMGPVPAGRIWTAGDDPRPVSDYGRSKLAGEESVRNRAGDVPATILRPPIVFGRGDPVTFAWFQCLVKWKLHLVPCETAWRYSLIDVEDLVAAMVQGARQGQRVAVPTDVDVGRHQGVYFVAHNEMPTYGEIGRMVAEALGIKRFRTWRVPSPAIWLGAVGGEIAGLLTGKASFLGIDKAREAVAGSWVCSADTATRDLGFVTGAPLLNQFCSVANWYRQEGRLT